MSTKDNRTSALNLVFTNKHFCSRLPSVHFEYFVSFFRRFCTVAKSASWLHHVCPTIHMLVHVFWLPMDGFRWKLIPTDLHICMSKPKFDQNLETKTYRTLVWCSRVRSESRCALRLRYVDLVVSIEVAVEVWCCFAVFSC
jgi:hypothetical protein